MKSTSSWPSRQTSRYSGFVVRTTVVVRRRAGLRDHRGDDVRLVARRAGDQEVGLRDPGRREHAPAGAVSLDRVRRRSAARSRRAAPRRGRRPSARARRAAPARSSLRPGPAPMTKIFTRGGYCAVSRTLWLSCAPDEVAASHSPASPRSAPPVPPGPRRSSSEQAQFKPRAVASGFEQPVFVTGREGRARPPVRRRAGRHDPGARRTASGARRRSSTSAASSRPAASRDCSGSRSIPRTRRCASSTSSTRPATASTKLVEYRTNGTHAPSAPRQLFSSRDPYGNHNGGMLAFGPNGRLYFTMGDGGAGGDPENRSQNMRSLFGKLLSINVATKGLGSRRSASATRGASRSTARTATSTSATSARARSRRSTTRRRRAPASRTTAGTSTRAARSSRTRRSARASS